MSPSATDFDPRPLDREYDNTVLGIYEKEYKCHHFTSADHLQLGADLACVFYKVLVSTPENNERLKILVARYINHLHKTPAQNTS